MPGLGCLVRTSDVVDPEGVEHGQPRLGKSGSGAVVGHSLPHDQRVVAFRRVDGVCEPAQLRVQHRTGLEVVKHPNAMTEERFTLNAIAYPKLADSIERFGIIGGVGLGLVP